MLGTRESIKKADKRYKYICPACREEVVLKQGKVMVWHFAHKSKHECVEYYDNKSIWHRCMQELFPEKNREIYNNEFNRHIFDILTDKNRIIEFQQSALTREAFQKRTYDYSCYCFAKGGDKPIWVFNYAKKMFEQTEKTYDIERRKQYNWTRNTKIFSDFSNYNNSWNKGYELWFLINPYLPKDFKLRKIWNGEEEIVTKVLQDGAEPLGGVFVNIKALYNVGKYVVGDVYTKEEFEEYIKNQ